jgi:hypothetical protein
MKKKRRRMLEKVEKGMVWYLFKKKVNQEIKI